MERQNEWKSFLKTPFKNCRYIYPIQQKKVEKMINHLKNNDNVIKIIVFGSSVTSKCHAGSDVDFYVEVKEDKRIITLIPHGKKYEEVCEAVVWEFFI